MALAMAHNRINVRAGDRAFIVASNLCDLLQIGAQDTAYLLVAEMVGPDKEFLFNGRLFVPGHDRPGTIIDNFPKGPTPKGWAKYPLVDGNGFTLIEPASNITLFGFEEIDNICHIITNLYDETGAIVAETLPDNFLVHRGPAMIGRGGIVI